MATTSGVATCVTVAGFASGFGAGLGAGGAGCDTSATVLTGAVCVFTGALWIFTGALCVFTAGAELFALATFSVWTVATCTATVFGCVAGRVFNGSLLV